MSKKLPSLQFYPGDWRKDPGVQALDYFDRGVWFELLLLMFESEERGRLLLNGNPMPDAAAARLLGLDIQKWLQCKRRLIEYGVTGLDDQGTLFSRRMIKDEQFRQSRVNNGSQGGRPKTKTKPTVKPTQKPKRNLDKTPSSSSSSSSSEFFCINKRTKNKCAPSGDTQNLENHVLKPPEETLFDNGSNDASQGENVKPDGSKQPNNPVSIFCEEYKRWVGSKATILPADAKLLTQAGKAVSDPKLFRRVCREFLGDEDQFLAREGYSPRHLLRRLNKYLQAAKSGG